ncbi:uncharacterized protein LOC110036981 [Phalaenopsis equestris]|uniref:uncharacterized protein LOC110036981 n=1 Tax=Phalaenopsis equestris TaxID=78828 RepID=UPI0009E578BD|nr:uncharacterized protein LOC110036981 [Phalaenopsis equestris]
MQIEGNTMNIPRWSTDFDPNKELPIVPIWFKLPWLKLHFFNHKVLLNIGQALEKPLKLEVPTFNLSRPSVARSLVERDITLPIVDEILLGTEHNGYWQKIIAEQKPYYCYHCCMFGHTNNKFFKLHHPRRKFDNPRAPNKDTELPPLVSLKDPEDELATDSASAETDNELVTPALQTIQQEVIEVDHSDPMDINLVEELQNALKDEWKVQKSILKKKGNQESKIVRERVYSIRDKKSHIGGHAKNQKEG